MLSTSPGGLCVPVTEVLKGLSGRAAQTCMTTRPVHKERDLEALGRGSPVGSRGLWESGTAGAGGPISRWEDPHRAEGPATSGTRA